MQPEIAPSTISKFRSEYVSPLSDESGPIERTAFVTGIVSRLEAQSQKEGYLARIV